MVDSDRRASILAYYSPWKVAAGESFLFALCVIPLLPGAQDRATIYKPFYDGPIFTVIVVVCGLLGALCIAYLPILFRAIMSKPALVAYDDKIVFYKMTSGHFLKSDVQYILGLKSNEIEVKLNNGKVINLPIFFYKSPKELRESIRETIFAN